LTADLDRAPLSVLLDVRHPLAYLALRPAIAFGKTGGIAINWLPLTVPTLKPPGPEVAADDRSGRHRRYRAQAIAREIETYGAAQGLVIRDFYRSDDAEAATLAWLWVRDRHPDRLEDFLLALLRGYWSLEVDVARAESVAALIDEWAEGGKAFVAWSRSEGPPAAAALAAELRGHGLFQVPAYVVGDEVFYGRQHLAMIAWILHGRTGPVPI
jgi:2-hydroxychromene-2-carboxylate isomerase